MKLFQYWDTGEPPDDVTACIQSVRELNPEFDHRLFDRDGAAWFIGKRLGQRQKDAFLALAVPAAQADYFRLCAIWARGGLWLDADDFCVRPLRLLMAEARDGLLAMMRNQLINGFLFVPRCGDAFIGACLELATRNIEARLKRSVHTTTGPLVLNAIWAAIEPTSKHPDPHLVRLVDPRGLMAEARRAVELHPGADIAFRRFTRRHVFWLRQCLKDGDLDYKSSERHWRNWQGSIYRETVPAQQG